MTTALLSAIFTGSGILIGAIGKVIVDVIKAKKAPDASDLQLEERMDQQKVACNNVITQLSNDVEHGFNELKQSIAEMNKVIEFAEKNQMVSIRHSLTEIYYRYQKEKIFPHNIKQDVCFLFEAYESLGGNSYVHELYEEMMTWKTE